MTLSLTMTLTLIRKTCAFDDFLSLFVPCYIYQMIVKIEIPLYNFFSKHILASSGSSSVPSASDASGLSGDPCDAGSMSVRYDKGQDQVSSDISDQSQTQSQMGKDGNRINCTKYFSLYLFD